MKSSLLLSGIILIFLGFGQISLAEESKSIKHANLAVSSVGNTSNIGGVVSADFIATQKMINNSIQQRRAIIKLGVVSAKDSKTLPYGQIGAYILQEDEANSKWGLAVLDPAIIQHDGNLFLGGASPIFISRSYINKDGFVMILTPKFFYYFDIKQDLQGAGGSGQIYLDKNINSILRTTFLATIGMASSSSDKKDIKFATILSARTGLEFKISKDVAINGSAFISTVSRFNEKEELIPTTNSGPHVGGELGLTAKF